MSIIVTGATGYIARHTVEQLLARGLTPRELILVTRTPGALAERASQGAQVRYGDFGEPDSLAAAFAGGEQIFLIGPAPESFATDADHLTAQRAAIAAAAAAGVKHAVLQSRLAAHESLGDLDMEAARSETALRDSGMAWTMLRTTTFADSRGRAAKHSVREGRIVTSDDLDARSRFVTRDDIVAAAAVVLADDSHSGKNYHLLGPAVSVREIAALLGELAGRPIEVVQMEHDAYARQMVERSSIPRIARLATQIGRQVRELGLRLTCDLPALLGREGQSLLDFLRANRQELVTGTPPTGHEPLLI